MCAFLIYFFNGLFFYTAFCLLFIAKYQYIFGYQFILGGMFCFTFHALSSVEQHRCRSVFGARVFCAFFLLFFLLVLSSSRATGVYGTSTGLPQSVSGFVQRSVSPEEDRVAAPSFVFAHHVSWLCRGYRCCWLLSVCEEFGRPQSG